MKLHNVEQGTDEWKMVKLCKPSMSHASTLRVNGAGNITYARQLVAEKLIGLAADDGYISNDMMRGIELESYARRAFIAQTGMDIEQIGFVETDYGYGCSPDGWLPGQYGLEIKCPKPHNHLAMMDIEKVLEEYNDQMQGGMLCCEVDRWFFVSFCPEIKQLPIIIHEISQDKKTIEKIHDGAINALEMRDKMLMSMPDDVNSDVARISVDAAKHWKYLTELNNGEVKL